LAERKKYLDDFYVGRKKNEGTPSREGVHPVTASGEKKMPSSLSPGKKGRGLRSPSGTCGHFTVRDLSEDRRSALPGNSLGIRVYKGRSLSSETRLVAKRDSVRLDRTKEKRKSGR